MKVNEIFYSLQGEGRNTGRASIFVRLSGCNLQCPFCDTQHQQGEQMDVKQIMARIVDLTPEFHILPLIVLTGGEPTLQDCTELIESLHNEGYEVAIETNGTRKPAWLELVDFVTLSPKFEFTNHADIVLKRCDELKVVYNGRNDLHRYDGIRSKYNYLQPCDTGDKAANDAIIKESIAYCQRNPAWRLSLQTQKIVGIL